MQESFEMIFDGQFRVRVVGTEDPKFVGKDICDILGYENASRTMTLHCKGVPEWYTLETAGGPQKFRVISEPDLMRLICASKLPAAEQFERWVFEEVLPSIRRHGAYITTPTLEKLVSNPDLVIELASKLKEEQARVAKLREERVADRHEIAENKRTLLLQSSEIETMRPKADFVDKFCRADDTILVRDFAKHVSQALGIHFRQCDAFNWLITHKYMNANHYPSSVATEKGLLWVKEGVREHRDGSPAITHTTKITPAGQVYFFEKIKQQYKK